MDQLNEIKISFSGDMILIQLWLPSCSCGVNHIGIELVDLRVTCPSSDGDSAAT